MFRLITGTVALSLALFITTGCKDTAPAPQPQPQAEPAKDQVLVVDLDRVVKALDKDKQIEAEIQAHNQKIAQQMVAIAQQWKKQFEDKQKEFGDNPTEEQKNILQTMALEASQKWQGYQNQASASARNERSRLYKKFQNLVSIEGKAIAQERGAKVVVAKIPNVLWHEDAVDITDEVIKAMLANPEATATPTPSPTPTPAPAPAPTPAPETGATDATQPGEAAE